MKNFLPLRFTKLLMFSFFLLITSSLVTAQQRQIILSGFTQDVIADAVTNTTPVSLTTSTVDSPFVDGKVFYAQGYSNDGETIYPNGLPANGQFTSSAGHDFQLAAYNGLNVLQLVALQSATLTFSAADQVAYTDLFVLATGGSQAPIVNYVVHFTDATTFTGGFTVDDWFCNNCTPYAIRNLGRVDRELGTLQGTQFAMREFQISLSGANQAKLISSIDFSVPAFESGIANIFGITGLANIVVPVTLEYYTARAENGTAYLQWKTSQEVNNKKFIIDRASSTSPTAFTTLGELPAVKSPNGSVYNYTNIPALPGTYLYRLSQVDIDGNKKIIGTKSITITGKNKWVVQDLGSQWKLISDQAFTYRLIDMYGRVIKSAKSSGEEIITKPVAQGIYQLQVEIGGNLSNQNLLR